MARDIYRLMSEVSSSMNQGGEAERNTADYDVTLAVGHPETEIVQFVEGHREVVLAVFDPGGSDKDDLQPDQLMNKLSIPTVTIEKKKKPVRGEAMKRFGLQRKNKVTKIQDTVDRYGEAVTYAEAGMSRESMEVLTREAEENPKIIVLGRGAAFSQALMDYAVALAKRLSYEIVAVSARSIPSDYIPLVGQIKDKIRQDFTAQAKEAALTFERQSQAAGVPWTIPGGN